jgi:hypothetical protein
MAVQSQGCRGPVNADEPTALTIPEDELWSPPQEQVGRCRSPACHPILSARVVTAHLWTSPSTLLTERGA